MRTWFTRRTVGLEAIMLLLGVVTCIVLGLSGARHGEASRALDDDGASS